MKTKIVFFWLNHRCQLEYSSLVFPSYRMSSKVARSTELGNKDDIKTTVVSSLNTCKLNIINHKFQNYSTIGLLNLRTLSELFLRKINIEMRIKVASERLLFLQIQGRFLLHLPSISKFIKINIIN